MQQTTTSPRTMGRATAADGYSQARIRLREGGAFATKGALIRYEDFLLDALTLISEPGTRKKFNAEVRETRRVLDELDRTMEEHGWNDLGQSERPDEG
jgi:hypothetical protein